MRERDREIERERERVSRRGRARDRELARGSDYVRAIEWRERERKRTTYI